MPHRTLSSLIFLTGAAGLTYQIVWQRYLTRLLGNDNLATAMVLGLFLGGLAAGYFLAGRMSMGRRDPLMVYAVLEAIIGVWGLLFPLAFRAVDAMTADWSFAAPWGLVIQGAGSAALLTTVPTVCMGGTVPLLTRALTRSVADATAVHAKVYAWNTAGAALGALLAGFVSIQTLGLPGTLRLAAVVNVLAAAYFVRLARRSSPLTSAHETQPDATQSTPAPAARWPLYAIAFSAGAYFMTFEALIIRITKLSLGSSSYSFAMIVGAFVLATALGAAWVARRRSISSAALFWNQALLVLFLSGLFLTLDKWPWAFHLLRVSFPKSAAAWGWFHLAAFLALLLVLIIPVGLMGATLPLVFHRLRHAVDRVGLHAGAALGWNACGNMFGGIVGGFVVFRWFGMGEVYLLALVAVLITMGLALIGLPRRVALGGLGLALPVVLLMAFFPFDPLRFAVGTFRLRERLTFSSSGPSAFYEEFYRSRTVLAFRDDPQGTFAVVENPRPAEALLQRFPGLARSVLGTLALEAPTDPRPRSIIVNGKSDSSTYFDRETLKLLAHLPALASRGRERVMIIGLGTGVTAAEFALYPDVQSIDVAEISPAVVDLLPFFAESTRSVHDEPRLRVETGDAFRIVGRSQETWNIISSEPSNPWVTGVDQVFSREFYQMVRQHLAPGGMFLQWMQGYTITDAIEAIVVNTLQAEFPHVRVFQSRAADNLFLASMSPIPDAAFQRGLTELEHNAALRESLADLSIHGLEELVARERTQLVLANAARSELGIESLDRPRLHYMAGRAFFAGGGAASIEAGSPDWNKPLAPEAR